MKGKRKARNKVFKVGDKIVDFGQVHRIFKIKKRKSPKGKEGNAICYQHYYQTPLNKSFSYSIPIANINKTKLRKPISKKELHQLLEALSKKSGTKKSFNTNRAKGILNLNDPFKTAQVLKRLWLEKNNESKNLSKTKRDIFKLAMKRLVEEVAFVAGISPAKAKEKIEKTLG